MLHPMVGTAFGKALAAARRDPGLLKGYGGITDTHVHDYGVLGRIELKRMRMGNRVFADHPERFGLTPEEGSALRSYFDSNEFDQEEFRAFSYGLIFEGHDGKPTWD